MNLKQTALAATVAGTLAMGASGPANAYIYAASGLSVDGLTVVISPFTSVTVNRFDFTLINTAFLNGNGDLKFATCGGTPGAGNNNCTPTIGSMDADAANAPGSTLIRPNNSTTGGEFTYFGPLTGFTGNWSNSDSQIVTAELVNLGSPTSTRNIAESLLTTGTTAAASSEIKSITGFTIDFTISGDGPATLDLSFLADPDLLAAIFGQPPGTFSASADLNASFTLSQQTGGSGVVNWNPQGTPANDCTASGGPTCTETADTQDLNRNVGTTTNNTQDAFSFDPNVLTETAFGIHVTGLTAGRWTLTLDEVKSTSLAFTPAQVPEPGTLALMGLGLLGLFASARRKKLV